ncbi:MAG: hypothetical protein K2O45_17755 [Oscillospiraceae bacterium]|nr:hypothetical protein [Oscillospiraceae bacterium]
MNELVRILYDHAYEHRMPYYLDDESQYRESSIMIDRQYKDLQKMLTADGQQRLEDYAGEKSVLHDLELEAIFRAGISIGLELSRL